MVFIQMFLRGCHIRRQLNWVVNTADIMYKAWVNDLRTVPSARTCIRHHYVAQRGVYITQEVANMTVQRFYLKRANHYNDKNTYFCSLFLWHTRFIFPVISRKDHQAPCIHRLEDMDVYSFGVYILVDTIPCARALIKSDGFNIDGTPPPPPQKKRLPRMDKQLKQLVVLKIYISGEVCGWPSIIDLQP